MNALLAELIMYLQDICVTYLRGQIMIQLGDEINHRCGNVKVFLIAFLQNLPDDFNSDELVRRNVHDEVKFLNLIGNITYL